MKVFFAIILIVAFAFTSQAQQCALRLTGHVEDVDLNDKLPGANVNLITTGMQMITDSSGDFVFSGLCPGKYLLVIKHVNCDSVVREIEIDKSRHIDIRMAHARKTLGEVVIEGKKLIAESGFKKELSGRALEESRGLTLAETLSKVNGVTMLQTGSTIAKPVIHGLHGNRILTINNGVRQEGQQWGNEHAPEIDPFVAERLAVIKGVDELRYGSDAIGGVILVEPKALRSTPGINAELNTVYFTNNRQYVVSGLFEQQLPKLKGVSYRVQGTFKKAANVRTPNYRLNNTATEEKNFSFTAGIRRKRWNDELYYSLFSTKAGIFTGSHIGNLTDLENAIRLSKPDAVFLGQNSYSVQRPYQDVLHHIIRNRFSYLKGRNRINFLLAAQANHRKEFDIVRSSANSKPQLDLSVLTLSEDLSWQYHNESGLTSLIGIAAMQQDNSYSGRYFIPNYFSQTYGGYIIEKWSFHDWELQAGLRYDYKTIETRRLKYNGDTINHRFNYSTPAGTVNIIFRPSKIIKLNAGVSYSSRAPYVNELLSDGIHHGTATYERGDIHLVPEKAINFSVGLAVQNNSGKISAEVDVYSNNIRDFIYQQPVPDAPVLTIAGAFPLIEYKQTDAVLNGIDVAARFKLFVGRLELYTKAAALFAKNKKTNDWLIWMPANRLSNEVSWLFKDGKKFADTYLSAELVHVMRQSRVPAETQSKQDYKDAPDAYTLLHINASSTVTVSKIPFTFSIGVRNLLNTVYRDYLNFFRYYSDEMGRNINFRIRIPINRYYREK